MGASRPRCRPRGRVAERRRLHLGAGGDDPDLGPDPGPGRLGDEALTLEPFAPVAARPAHRALDGAGFATVRPAGTYFVVADAAPLGFDDAAEMCRRLPELAGVVGVPVTAFCAPGSPTLEALRSWVRFTYVKQEPVLHQAAEGLARL